MLYFKRKLDGFIEKICFGNFDNFDKKMFVSIYYNCNRIVMINDILLLFQIINLDVIFKFKIYSSLF